MSATRTRAEPLAPEDRRRSIIRAVIPLLIQQGWSVTTRQMADAAGVAEGTIFRVFPDKDALIREALRTSMDPAPVAASLSSIDGTLPLERQLAAATRILLERIEEVVALMSVIHSMPAGHSHLGSRPPRFVSEANATILAAVSALLSRHADQLRVDPGRAAVVVVGLIVASAHPALIPGANLSVGEIVDALMGGIVAPRETEN